MDIIILTTNKSRKNFHSIFNSITTKISYKWKFCWGHTMNKVGLYWCVFVFYYWLLLHWEEQLLIFAPMVWYNLCSTKSTTQKPLNPMFYIECIFCNLYRHKMILNILKYNESSKYEIWKNTVWYFYNINTLLIKDYVFSFILIGSFIYWYTGNHFNMVQFKYPILLKIVKPNQKIWLKL